MSATKRRKKNFRPDMDDPGSILNYKNMIFANMRIMQSRASQERDRQNRVTAQAGLDITGGNISGDTAVTQNHNAASNSDNDNTGPDALNGGSNNGPDTTDKLAPDELGALKADTPAPPGAASLAILASASFAPSGPLVQNNTSSTGDEHVPPPRSNGTVSPQELNPPGNSIPYPDPPTTPYTYPSHESFQPRSSTRNSLILVDPKPKVGSAESGTFLSRADFPDDSLSTANYKYRLAKAREALEKTDYFKATKAEFLRKNGEELNLLDHKALQRVADRHHEGCKRRVAELVDRFTKNTQNGGKIGPKRSAPNNRRKWPGMGPTPLKGDVKMEDWIRYGLGESDKLEEVDKIEMTKDVEW